jgi:cytochrome P450
VLRKLARSGRDLITFQTDSYPEILINDPDHARHVLALRKDNYTKETPPNEQFRRHLADGILTSEGERWRRERAVLQPAFRQSERVRATARELTERLCDRLAGAARTGEPVDLSRTMSDLTIAITGHALFDLDLGAAAELIGTATNEVFDSAPGMLAAPDRPRVRQSRDEVLRMIDSGIQDRTASSSSSSSCPFSGKGGEDLLSVLIQDEDHSGDALLQQVLTVLLAGYETTANALTWVWILTARHPEARRDWEAALAGSDGAGERHTLAVFRETLRLYPPAWVIGRRAIEDDQIGKHRIPAGAVITISPFALHRHPKYWSRPDEFDPSRFLPGGERPRNRYAYIPFGAGPRYCIGAPYADAEAAEILPPIARRFRFELITEVPEQPESRFVLRAPAPLWVRVEERTGSTNGPRVAQPSDEH